MVWREVENGDVIAKDANGAWVCVWQWGPPGTFSLHRYDPVEDKYIGPALHWGALEDCKAKATELAS